MATTTISAIANKNFEAMFGSNTMTAKEMALTSHNLSHGGKYARTKEALYTWSDTRGVWAQIDKN